VVPSIDPADARRQAEAILSERRFQVERTPRPFAGVLDWFGARLRTLGRPFGWLARQFNKVLPGGGNLVWIMLTIGGIVIVALAARRVGLLRRRRTTEAASSSIERLTADELERMATEAEMVGDLSLSVRLRFRAGLRRLADGRAINSPEQRPNGDIGRQLALASYSSLAHRVDAITYAHAVASPDDVRTARAEWPNVVRAGIDQRAASRRSSPIGPERPSGRGPLARIKRRRFDRNHR
jgi:hypothetical protein